MGIFLIWKLKISLEQSKSSPPKKLKKKKPKSTKTTSVVDEDEKKTKRKPRKLLLKTMIQVKRNLLKVTLLHLEEHARMDFQLSCTSHSSTSYSRI
jgi:hypothetical protein